ncbi:hypothetical protein D3C78_1087430 [compost metagenome]
MLELEQDALWVFRDDLGNVSVIATKQRCALFDQGVEGEHHVVGVNRMAIVKARFRAKVEAHPAVVRGLLDLAGHQAVLGEGFVQALGHQGVIDQADVVGRNALVDVRV